MVSLHANRSFSCIYRYALGQFNKHFHIWAGRFAYAAGVVQCYRGLELVSSDDQLIFSAGDGLDLQVRLRGYCRQSLPLECSPSALDSCTCIPAQPFVSHNETKGMR